MFRSLSTPSEMQLSIKALQTSDVVVGHFLFLTSQIHIHSIQLKCILTVHLTTLLSKARRVFQQSQPKLNDHHYTQDGHMLCFFYFYFFLFCKEKTIAVHLNHQSVIAAHMVFCLGTSALQPSPSSTHPPSSQSRSMSKHACSTERPKTVTTWP